MCVPTLLFQEPNIPKNPTQFLDNPARRHVLSGKSFVFSGPRALKQLANIIPAAGGTTNLLSEDLIPALLKGEALLAKTAEDFKPSPQMAQVCRKYAVQICNTEKTINNGNKLLSSIHISFCIGKLLILCAT